MIESACSRGALLGAVRKGIVAEHLVQHRRPVAGPECQVALRGQHDEPQRSSTELMPAVTIDSVRAPAREPSRRT